LDTDTWSHPGSRFLRLTIAAKLLPPDVGFAIRRSSLTEANRRAAASCRPDDAKQAVVRDVI
jgi:hypothetical protein